MYTSCEIIQEMESPNPKSPYHSLQLAHSQGFTDPPGISTFTSAAHLNEVRLGSDVALSLVPRRDDGVRQSLQVGVALEDLLQQSQGAAAGADAELRVEGEHHQLVHSVTLHLHRTKHVSGSMF